MSALRLHTAIVSGLVAASLLARPAPASGLSSAFTYQGQLSQTGTPITGTCDLQFSLFDAATTGTQLGSTETLSAVSVTDGLFTVALNDSAQFGTSAFAGSDRWLQIAVRCPAGSGGYSTLSSRQQLTAAPYALYAPTAGSAAGVSCGGCVTSGDLAAGAVTGSAIASGTIQQSNLGFTPVLSVGANSPLASSGGQTPSISLTGTVSVANGGTGASTATTARASLGAAASGANSDITALLGFTGSNVALGQNALHANTTGVDNIAVGDGALQANTNGTENTAVGHAALYSNTSANNTALGAFALRYNTTGTENAAVGDLALYGNTTGADNTAVGSNALYANTTGPDNAALGAFALQDNTTGAYNTAVGQGALLKNSTVFDVTKCTGSGMPNGCCSGIGTGFCGASYNTAVGTEALGVNTAGSSNTALGESALSSLKTGSGNLALGFEAGSSLTGAESNNVYIDNAGVAGESNAIRIGTESTQTKAFIAGIYSSAITSAMPVVVNSNGRLGLAASSARFKEDIQDMGDSTTKLMQLRPVRFRYKLDIDPSGLEQYGLVAEEVAKVYPDLVLNDADGRPYTVRYQFLAPMLLNEVQKQGREITAQQKEISTQAHQIRQLTERTPQRAKPAQQISDQTRRLTKQAQQIAALQRQVEELSTLKEETAALQARLAALEAAGMERTAAQASGGTPSTAAAF